MFTAVVWTVELRAFYLALTAEGLRARTIRNYARSVERFARHSAKPVQEVSVDDLRGYLVSLQQRLSPKSVYEERQGLRRFFGFLHDDGELDNDPAAALKPIRYQVRPQTTYSETEVKRLLLVCDAKTRAGLRDRAVIMVLFDTGARVGELVSMGLPDWTSGTVEVEGKTGARTVYLGMSALQAVERYARRWRIADGRLWRGKKGPLTESGVHQAVARLCARAGIEDKGVHAFRRAAAAQMKRLGMQDSDILEVMGWRSITMLRRYTAAVSGELAQHAHREHSPGDALRTGGPDAATPSRKSAGRRASR